MCKSCNLSNINSTDPIVIHIHGPGASLRKVSNREYIKVTKERIFALKLFDAI